MLNVIKNEPPFIPPKFLNLSFGVLQLLRKKRSILWGKIKHCSGNRMMEFQDSIHSAHLPIFLFILNAFPKANVLLFAFFTIVY